MSFQMDLEVAAPYPGLRPFRREEAQVFFGRDAQIDDILGRLKKNQFLGVVGSSGCGKSSLIRAGILPALESGLMGEVGSTWFVVDMKPGDAPMTNLAKALVNSKVFGDRWTDSPESIALLTATLRRSDVALVNLVKQLLLPNFTNILILADQFEEIFRFQQQDPNEALAFVNLLLSTALDRTVPTYVVLTMRTDFLGQCATFPGLPEALNDSQYLCPRMTRDQLAEAIEGPASVFGATVERGLITQLINDAGSNSDQLPLVQHVLARMWNQQSSPNATLFREGEAPAEPLSHSMSNLSSGSAGASPSRITNVVTNGPLTVADYFQSGGLFSLPGLRAESRLAFSSGAGNESAQAIPQNALSRHADEAYFEVGDPALPASMADGAEHKPSPLQWVAQMLFRSLAERSVSGQLVRRPVKLRAVAEIVKEPTGSLDAAIDRVKSVVEVFRREDRSFLVPPPGVALSGESVLDISHEALIRQWRRLAGEGEETTDGVGSNVGWLMLEDRARRRYRRLAEAAEAESTSGLMHDPELSFLNAWWAQFQPRRAWGNGVIPGSFDRTEIYLRKSLHAAEEETKKERLAAEHLLTLQQDKIRSTRRLLKIAGAIAVVALVFAFIAWRAQVAAVLAKSTAVTEKDRADTAADTAKANAEKAESEKVRAEVLRDRSEHLLYASQVRTAEREFAEDHFEVALQNLDACRWDYRGWEHDNLYSSNFRLRGHSGSVNSVSFSPDGKRIVSGSGDETLKLWDAESGAELRTLTGHSGSVNSVSFSRDGKWIVSGSGSQFADGSGDNTLKLWDAKTGAELRTLTGHSEVVSSVSFSPDGKRLVSGSEDKTVKLWDAETGAELRTLTGDSNSVNCVSFSPDGKRIVSGGYGELKLWDAATGAELRTVTGHSSHVRSVSFSPDGKRIVSGSDDTTLKLWDAETGAELRTLTGHSSIVTSVSFSPDGNRIVSGSDDNTLKLWGAETGAELRTLTGHSKTVSSVCFSPDGKWIVSGSDDNTLKMWDAKTGAELRTLTGDSNSVNCVSFSPDGKRIVSGGYGELKLWDAATGAELRTLTGHPNGVHCVSFSPDGRRLVSGGNGQLKLWDAETGAELRTLTGHSFAMMCVSFRPDGKRIVSGSDDRTLTLWDAETGAELHTLTGHLSHVNSVSFSPDGKRIVSGSSGWDDTLKLWDAETGAELHTLTGHAGTVNSVSFSLDGEQIVSGSDDKTLKLWDAETGAELRTLTGHTDIVTSVSFSADGKRIVSGSDDKTLKLWDALTAPERRTNLTGHLRNVNTVSFRPDGEQIVSGSDDNMLKLWDAETGAELRSLTGHSGGIKTVSFSPDGKRIVSGSEPFDNSLQLWDANAGVELPTLKGHRGEVRTVSFSPDGKRIASGCNDFDDAVKLWDAETGAKLRTLTGHTDTVWSVSFSPDGRRIVSGSEDKTLKLWDAETGAELRTLTGHSDRVFSVSFSPDGKRIVSGSMDRTLKLWDAETGAELRTLTGHTDIVTSVIFSSDGKRIVSGSGDHTLKLWDAETGAELQTLTGHSDVVTSVSFSPDGKQIVSGSWDYTLKLWDAKRRRAMLPIHVTTGRGEVTRAISSQDDAWILSGDNKGRVNVYSYVSGQMELDLPGHMNSIVALAVHPDMTQVASASSDDTVIFWDLQTDAKRPTLVKRKTVRPKDDEMQWCMAYSSDGTLLAMGTREGTVRIWDSQTKAERQPIVTNGSHVKGLEFINGNQQLLTMGVVKGGESSEINIWDVKSGAIMRTVATIPGKWTAGFARHGNLIASGSDSGQLKVWDLTAGNELFSLDNAHLKDIHGIAFSPDGSLLATGSSDGMAKIWTVESTTDGTLSVKQAIELTEHKLQAAFDYPSSSWLFGSRLTEPTADVTSVTFSHHGTRLVSAGKDGYVRVWLLEELMPRHFRNKTVLTSVSPDSSKIITNPVAVKVPPPLTTPTAVSTWSTVMFFGFVIFVAIIAISAQRRRKTGQQVTSGD